MNEQIHAIATNFLYAVPITMLITGIFLQVQKTKLKNPAKNTILNNSFIFRNSLFVGLLTFVILYLGKPLPGLEESIIVSPADF